jgi:hypothetical protein
MIASGSEYQLIYRSVKQTRSELTSVWLEDRSSSVFATRQRRLSAIVIEGTYTKSYSAYRMV